MYNLFIVNRMSSYGYSIVHRKDLHLTRIVVIIVLVFLVLNFPRLVLGVYEISRSVFLSCQTFHTELDNNSRYNLMVDCFNSPASSYHGPEWQLIVDILARYMAVINSSINFIIYCVFGKKFRSVRANLLHLKSNNKHQ